MEHLKSALWYHQGMLHQWKAEPSHVHQPRSEAGKFHMGDRIAQEEGVEEVEKGRMGIELGEGEWNWRKLSRVD